MNTAGTTHIDSSAPQPPDPPPSSVTGRRISIGVAVTGAAALLAAGVAAGLSVATGTTPSDEAYSQRVDGLAGLDIDVSSANVNVVYGAVAEAELQVSDARADWLLDLDGDTLVVRRDSSIVDIDWFGGWLTPNEAAVLTLPMALRESAVDADVKVSSGSFDADGVFGTVGLDVSGGSLHLGGTVNDLDVEVTSGRAELMLDAVSEARVSVSGGGFDGELTGDAPRDVTAEVRSGSLDLPLPRTAYDVRYDVTAGSFDNQLDVSTSAPHRVTVDVSAGSAAIRPATDEQP